jgi:hypothetical protein
MKRKQVTKMKSIYISFVIALLFSSSIFAELTVDSVMVGNDKVEILTGNSNSTNSSSIRDENKSSDLKFRGGVGLVADIEKAGLVGKIFINEMFGLSIRVGSRYDREGYFGLTEVLFAFPTKTKFVPTISAGYGYDRVDFDTTINNINVAREFAISSFRTTAGVMVLLNRVELAADIGYVYGEVNYNYTTSPFGDDEYKQHFGTYKLMPFTSSLTVTVNFGKQFKKQ